MEFLTEPGWWMLTAACTGAASLPGIVRSIGKRTALAILALWIVLCAAVLLRFSLVPTIATAALSGLIGTLFLIASLIFSGIRSMPNQRFEER